jgi:hypothetical protein
LNGVDGNLDRRIRQRSERDKIFIPFGTVAPPHPKVVTKRRHLVVFPRKIRQAEVRETVSSWAKTGE